MHSLPQHLIGGYYQFRNNEYASKQTLYEQLATHGQHPEVMIISCSDSRVDPNTIFNAGPGELFVSRNVANLVPPCEFDGSYHGVSAALEFAVLHLEVKHIIVLGHTNCGGIKAMLDNSISTRDDMLFISKWISLMQEARDDVMQNYGDRDDETKMEHLECLSIRKSLENLRTFSCIREKEHDGHLNLHGAYFDLTSGELHVLDPENGNFSPA